MAKIDYWKANHAKNEKRFNDMLLFLEANHARVDGFHLTSTHLGLGMRTSAKEKIYFAFLDCLNEAGGNNLTATGKACRKMRDALADLPDSSQISCRDFYSKLESSKQIDNSEKLFDYLKSGAFPNLRYKKAALFMQSIYYAQRQQDIRIFFDLEPKNIHLPIPLDVVIGEIVSIVLGIPYPKRIGSWDAKEFEQFAREELHDRYYILEDIWFWGYFGTRVRKNDYRIVDFNEGKYLTNRTFFPVQDPAFEGKVKEFCRVVNEG